MGLTEHLEQYSPEEEAGRIEDFLASKRSEIGFDSGIIGLSGGIDSSIAVVLAKRALSNDGIEVVFLPEPMTPDRDWDDVGKLERQFDLEVRTIEIGDLISGFTNKMASVSELTEANIKARIRMIVLYAIANQHHGVVIGTGNLSEWLLGYFTKYGDGASDISPLSHLYKTEITQMARIIDVPESIISKPPSAGLWDGQTDEEELGGSYEDIDQVLYCKRELNLAPRETKETVDLDSGFVDHVYGLVEKSAHKRKPPPGLTRR